MENKRLSYIENYLNEVSTTTTNELSSILKVSNVTIRKDLSVLESKGVLQRTHGGAIISANVPKTHYDSKIALPENGIKKIIDIAMSNINPGDTLFLGSGSTCLYLAQQLTKIENISIVTNNVSAVSVLAPYCANTILLGGEIILHNNMLYTSSEQVKKYMDGISINKSFTSAVGIHPTAGLTVRNMASSYIFKCIANTCSDWYVMMDSSKINKVALYQVATLNNIDYLITDCTDNDVLNKFSENGLNVINSLG